MDWRITKAIAHMNANLQRELTLSEVAHAVNLSTVRFNHLFKAAMGGSPMKYLKWLRMQKAKQLLETTPLSVKEIMHQVGVRDESHFVRDFEMACGLTPARYRADHHDPRAAKNSVDETAQQDRPIDNRIG